MVSVYHLPQAEGSDAGLNGCKSRQTLDLQTGPRNKVIFSDGFLHIGLE